MMMETRGSGRLVVPSLEFAESIPSNRSRKFLKGYTNCAVRIGYVAALGKDYSPIDLVMQIGTLSP